MPCRWWSRRPAAGGGALALASLIAGGVPAQAQTVEGTLVHQLSERPIAGAFVVLLDTAGVERARVLTDARGAFRVRAPAAGRYRLRAAVVGLKAWTSPLLDLGGTTPRRYPIRMPATPVRLPVLVVEADRDCRIRPEAGVAAGELWEEARKVLEAVVWTERTGLLRHRIVRYVRELDRRTLVVKSQQTRSREGWFGGSSFIAMAPDRLAAEGYVRRAGSDWEYFAPDARVLLSDEFADLHCFAVRDPGRAPRTDLVGLAFEPVRDREVPDVEGVLWLDVESAELRYLEYRYTGLPWRIDTRQLGGRLEFVRLEDGPWIVSRWWIRMPRLRTTLRRSDLRFGMRRGLLVEALREEGGWVDEVRTRDGRTLLRAPSARIEGRVIQGGTGARLPGASVHLVGAKRVAPTDEAGRFAFDSLHAGRFLLDPGQGPALPVPPTAVVLRGGDTVSVTLGVPTPEDLWQASCPHSDPGQEAGMVGGLVRTRESGAVRGGVTVVVTWQWWDVQGARVQARELRAEGVSDGNGYYRVCDVPAGIPLVIGTRMDGKLREAGALELGGSRVVRRDLFVEPSQPDR